MGGRLVRASKTPLLRLGNSAKMESVSTIFEESKITLKACAKINLTLEVLGRRDDGYHDVASIMQTIDLYDTVTLVPSNEITVECDVPELASEDNLAFKAARLLKEKSGTNAGAHIRIDKSIPLAAGMGGGSSDAAATLVGLNEMWDLSLSQEALSEVAAELGSDVPFLLNGGTAIALGRGERIRSLPPADLEWLVVLSPDIHLENKTATLYRSLTEANYTRGALTRKLEARIRGGGDVPPQFLFNAFDDVAFEAFPGLDVYWNTMHALGAREIHLSGSGPTIYAPVSKREIGSAVQLLLQHRHGWNAHLVKLAGARDNSGEAGRF